MNAVYTAKTLGTSLFIQFRLLKGISWAVLSIYMGGMYHLNRDRYGNFRSAPITTYHDKIEVDLDVAISKRLGRNSYM